MSEQVNHPTHYNTGKIEVIEIIEDQRLGFHLGNAVKYILRAGKKDPTKTIEDLQKAKWYLERKTELLKAERETRDPTRPNDMNPRADLKEFFNRLSHDVVQAINELPGSADPENESALIMTVDDLSNAVDQICEVYRERAEMGGLK